MFKKLGLIMILGIFALSVSGCATARKQKDMQIQELRNQVTVLESQIQNKDAEINSLREALDKTQGKESYSKSGKKRVIGEVKSRPTVKQIQIALQNAGYDVGNIDGKMGGKTREAIRAFQSANNLSADGKVGKQTWNLLRDYLYKKVK